MSYSEFQKYLEGMNQQPLVRKPENRGSGALLPHQRTGPAQGIQIQSFNIVHEHEGVGSVREGIMATLPYVSMNNGSLPDKPSSPEPDRELSIHQKKTLDLDHQPKPSRLQSAASLYQPQNPASVRRNRQCESPQRVNATKIPPHLNNGLAKSRWADTTYNDTPISNIGWSPIIVSTPVHQHRTTIEKQAVTYVEQKIDNSISWVSDKKRISPVESETAVTKFGPNIVMRRDNETDLSSLKISNHTQSNRRDDLGDLRNQTWESGLQLMTAASFAKTTRESPQSTWKSSTYPSRAEGVRAGEMKLIDIVPDPRGKWSSVSDVMDEISQSISSGYKGPTPRPQKEPSDSISSSTGQGKAVPQHLTEFIETWIRNAHVVKTDFLIHDIDKHEDRDVDTEKGVLMEKPVEYARTRRSQEPASRDQLEMTSELFMKRFAVKMARRDPERKAQRRAEKEERAAARAAAAAGRENLVEEPPNINEVQIPCHLRPAVESDIEAITAIYNQEIKDGYKVIDTKPVGQDEFRSIYSQCLSEKMPFVVAVEGWYGALDKPYQAVIGFALVTAVSRGIAGSYDTISRCGGKLLVIVKPECRRKRVGTALIDILITNCTGWYMPKGGYQFVNLTHDWMSKEFGKNSRKWWYLEMDVMIRSDENEAKTRQGEEFQWIWNFLEAKFDLLLKHYDEKCFCDPFEMWLDRLTFRRACQG
ncbi:hypothetical protein EKO27_g1240 [Xylaria grammica]|uniref:N-acetyltransferase domain-containing protein n=1 Tax=Xylaria grammica TaxID=363999 RepID=A0A439DHF4_9PEZI|nr:hypothetical protein EKO27_g1240 [Xylaria grammica]